MVAERLPQACHFSESKPGPLGSVTGQRHNDRSRVGGSVMTKPLRLAGQLPEHSSPRIVIRQRTLHL